MADESRERFLKEEDYYHENCPGCKMERHNQLHRGFPFRQLLMISFVVLVTGSISLHFSCSFRLRRIQPRMDYGGKFHLKCRFQTRFMEVLSIPLHSPLPLQASICLL